MTSVFLVFMTRSFSLQKLEKIETSFCSDSTEGANKTRSSAKANINKFKLAIVNSLHCDLVNVFYAK